ncbi:class I SAM-dependent methyltransferase [Clostridium ihumii]|uniref:class I SAM-dependent methyltransferase n=1 Tax=Clostridium ihumii TaxID=1470356 RepID=UPI00058B7401|nr:rRNA adenine N-6-methyltransferase family protein [Clostridium ihumii]
MFIIEYIKNPRLVGAIAPSGRYLADKMVNEINFNKAKCIVEFGPGTGVFTEKILSKVKEDTKVLLIEVNNEFYNILKEKYGYKNNVIIINDSAENIDIILKQNNIKNVDYILSGLPFASLPKEISRTILNKTAKIINEKGCFITFQYSLFKLKLFENYFCSINYKKEIRNLPPAYILQCRGEKNG